MGVGAEDTSFLARLELDARRALLALGTERRRRRGATLMFEGDAGDEVLVVLEGRAKVVSTTDEGRELVLALRGPGDLLGELTAIAADELPRFASVVALDDCRVQAIDGAAFRRFLTDHPEAGLVLLRMLVTRLRDSDRHRVEFGSLDVPHRVARLLVDLAGSGEHDGSGTVDIALPLSQEELAGMVSASRETLTRALGALRARRLIETGRRSIRILDLDRLRSYAEV